VRYRTATILSIVLIGGMFCLPEAIFAVFRPSGHIAEYPIYERILLDIAVFCGRFRWVFALPIVVVLFTVAAFTDARDHR
jgi:hypothetical protein